MGTQPFREIHLLRFPTSCKQPGELEEFFENVGQDCGILYPGYQAQYDLKILVDLEELLEALLDFVALEDGDVIVALILVVDLLNIYLHAVKAEVLQDVKKGLELLWM